MVIGSDTLDQQDWHDLKLEQQRLIHLHMRADKKIGKPIATTILKLRGLFNSPEELEKSLDWKAQVADALDTLQHFEVASGNATDAPPPNEDQVIRAFSAPGNIEAIQALHCPTVALLPIFEDDPDLEKSFAFVAEKLRTVKTGGHIGISLIDAYTVVETPTSRIIGWQPILVGAPHVEPSSFSNDKHMTIGERMKNIQEWRSETSTLLSGNTKHAEAFMCMHNIKHEIPTGTSHYSIMLDAQVPTVKPDEIALVAGTIHRTANFAGIAKTDKCAGWFRSIVMGKPIMAA